MKEIDVQSEREANNEILKKRNFIYFCIVAGIGGAEYSFIVPSLYSYLKDVVHTKDLSLWYGLVSSSYFSSSILAACFIMSKYADRTRNIRAIIIGTCFLVSKGNFIYVATLFPTLVLIGRSLQGFETLLHPFSSVKSQKHTRKYNLTPNYRWWYLFILSLIFQVQS